MILKKYLLLLLIALLVSTWFPIRLLVGSNPTSHATATFIAFADNQTSTNQTLPVVPDHQLTIDRPFYLQTKITLNFPATSNVGMTNVTTIANGGYNYAGGHVGALPDSFTFIAQDVDIYTFSFMLGYNDSESRSILISIWEGDRAMEGQTWTESGMSYQINFRLNTLNEPSPPTSEELSSVVLQKIGSLLVNQTDKMVGLEERINDVSFMNTILTVAGVTMSIVALVSSGFVVILRRKRVAE